MKVLILVTSLGGPSRSRVLADRAQEMLDAAGAQTCLVDLHELDLPLCGSESSFEHPQTPSRSAGPENRAS